MIHQELRDIIRTVGTIGLNDTLSDTSVTLLSRLYVAIYNMVSANGLDNEYGDAETFADRLALLYGICRIRSGADQPYGRRLNMIETMKELPYGVCRIADTEQSALCFGYEQDIISDCMTAAEKSATENFRLLKCIANHNLWLPEEFRDEDFGWFKKCVSAWIDELDCGCRWDGLSYEESLDRLDIMIRNSNMFLDETNDNVIENIYEYYSVLVANLLAESAAFGMKDFELLSKLYEVTKGMAGLGRNGNILDKLAGLAFVHGGELSESSEEKLICLWINADYECIRINREIKIEVLGETA